MAEREVKFWDCDDTTEQLHWTTLDEAVEMWADRLHPDPLPETVKVFGYAEMELPPAARFADCLLEDLIERLDEEHGNPEEETEQTEAMKAAALAFVQAVYAEYSVWSCEIVTSRVVKVADHVPAHWLTPPQSAVEDPSSRSPRTEGDDT